MFNFSLYFFAAFITALYFGGFFQKKNFSFILFFGLAIITAVIGRLIISLGLIVENPSLMTEILFATLFSATMTALFHKAFVDMFMRMLMGGQWVVVKVKHSFERIPNENK